MAGLSARGVEKRCYSGHPEGIRLVLPYLKTLLMENRGDIQMQVKEESSLMRAE